MVFTGAAGPATGSVVRRMMDRLGEARAVVVAPRPVEVPGAQVHVMDLVGGDLRAHLQGAEAVVHLGFAVDEADPYQLGEGRIPAEARAVLEAVRQSGAEDLVVVSSALVLGASPTNPVPLSEDATVRPAPGFRPAVEAAEVERLIAEHDDAAGHIAVLRAAPVVADGTPGWLAAELHRSLAYPTEDHDPRLQYLHADDLADAVTAVLSARPGGVYHVAPDGSLTGAQRRALETRPRLRVPDRLARGAATLRSAVRGTRGPEGVRPYLEHEWLLANDALRALGWVPTHSNEEAYVAAFRAAPWSMLGSGRRQELVLGSAGVLAAGVAVGIGALVRRRHH